jgi:uncharacterized repeat protein (TIGR01451 family)
MLLGHNTDVLAQDRAEIAVGRSPGGNMRWSVQNQSDVTDAIVNFESGGDGWGATRGVPALAFGDVDGDGRAEMMVGRNAGANLRWTLHDDATTLFRSIQSGGDEWGLTRGVTAIAMGDVDGDGRAEIAIGRNGGANMRWTLLRYDLAAGRLAQIQSGGEGWGGTRGVTALAMGDVDGDGRAELAIGRNAGSNMRWALYRYDPPSGRMVEMQSGGEGWGITRSVTALAMGDVDGDGRAELAVGRNDGVNQRWSLHRYDAASDRMVQVQSGGEGWGVTRGVTALAMGDVDGDLRAELVVGRNGGANMRWAVYRHDAAVDRLVEMQSGGDGWGIERGVTALALGNVDGDAGDELVIGRSPGPNMRWAVLRHDRATGRLVQTHSGGEDWGVERGASALAVGFARGRDQDGDGLLDHWERNGIDMDADGVVEFDLPAFGSDPRRRDLFVEVDCIVSDGNGNGSLLDLVDHSHCPLQAAIQDVVLAFANAPVVNPDGTSGIQLHVDTGSLYGPGAVTNVPGTGGVVGSYGDMGGGGDQIPEAGNTIVDWDGAAGRPGTSFYTLKAANFNAGRRFVFRYALFGHQTNARRASNDCTSGWAEDIAANDFMVMLGGRRDHDGDGVTDVACWASGNANGIDDDGDGAVDEDPPNGIDDDGDCTADSNGDGVFCGWADVGVDEDGGFSVGNRAQQAGTFMHELGHTLGLRHGGGDDINDKPNFLSLMNYAFQAYDVPAQPGVLPGGCDYSRDALATLNERRPPGLDECVGIDGVYGFGPMDWDGDGTFEGMSNCQPPNNRNVSADINGDGSQSALTGFDDWDNIRFDFRHLGNFADGVSNPVRDEPDPETIERSKRRLSQRLRPELTVEKTTPADRAAIGETSVYTLRVRNQGAGPAFGVVITDTLPDGSRQTFDLGTMPARSEQVRTVRFTVPADTPACGTLSNDVRVDYQDIVGQPRTTAVSVKTPVQAKYEYVAKLVCGVQADPTDLRLARGFYSTSISVHNPGCARAVLFKKLALTRAPGGQQPGKVLPIAVDRLKPDQALSVDCADIAERVFPKGSPGSYIEGFVVIQGPQSLDVTAMYSTAALDEQGHR